jgi:hypothetical protein
MFWFLPTHGDGRYLGTEEGARPVDYGYLQQINFFRHQLVLIEQVGRLLLASGGFGAHRGNRGGGKSEYVLVFTDPW